MKKNEKKTRFFKKNLVYLVPEQHFEANEPKRFFTAQTLQPTFARRAGQDKWGFKALARTGEELKTR